MIILRPGLGVVQPAALVALVSVLLYALYQVLTRMVGRSDSAETSLLWQLVVGAVLASFVVPFAWRTPEPEHWPLFVLVAALGGVGPLLHDHAPCSWRRPPSSSRSPTPCCSGRWSSAISASATCPTPGP